MSLFPKKDIQDGAEHGSRVASSEKAPFYLLFCCFMCWMLLV